MTGQMKHAVFIINLNQDVAASRPVALFFRKECALRIIFLATSAFRKRDASGLWFEELREIARDLQAELMEVSEVADAVLCLAGKSGLLLSASESALPAHEFSHLLFLAAPPSFTRVTLQHGLECIGFNHNEAHDRLWGHFIGMAADVAASWFEIDSLHSVRPDQAAKVVAVGPQIGLDSLPACVGRRRGRGYDREIHGLVCENLHSVRFTGADKRHFVSFLLSFARQIDDKGGTLELRPHPGGRYMEKNKAPLPKNVSMNRLPLYKQSLEKFAFCISGPSSVIFDMVWAGVPVAVWASDDTTADLGMYASLQFVRDENDWLDFAIAASRDPEPFLKVQSNFLEKLKIPSDIPARYRALAHLA